MSFSRSIIVLAAVFLALPCTPAPAQSPTTVPDQVEEDWQVVVATPDVLGVGPQITTCMSPLSDISTAFVAFYLNYRPYPSFQAGGLQVQVWSNNQRLTNSSQGSAQLNTANETITWTQRMSVSGGNVHYDVENGQSTTWGSFGQGEQLSVAFPAQVNALANYNPDVSAANSGVSWESNLVTSMTLVQVRKYAGGNLIATDTNPRTVMGQNSQ